VTFPILIAMTLTIVLHYHADCDFCSQATLSNFHETAIKKFIGQQ